MSTILKTYQRIVDPRHNSRPITFSDPFFYLVLQITWYSFLPIIFTDVHTQGLVHNQTCVVNI